MAVNQLNKTEIARIERRAKDMTTITMAYKFIMNRITNDIHEWRILAWIMAKLQLKNPKYQFPEDCRPMAQKTQEVLFRGENGPAVEITMPLSFVLYENEKTGRIHEDLDIAAKAFERLQRKGIVYRNYEAAKKPTGGKDVLLAANIPVVLAYRLFKAGNNDRQFVKFSIDNVFWEALLDFSEGYRIVELPILLNLKNNVARKIYMQVSRQRKPTVMSIDKVREWLDYKDRYPESKDFLRYAFGPAKKELDKISPFTFEVEGLGECVCETKYKSYRGRGNSLKYVRITPVYQKGKLALIDDRLEQFWRDNYTQADLRDDEIMMLHETFRFTQNDIIANVDLIVGCKHIKNGEFNDNWRDEVNFLGFLGEVKQSMLKNGIIDAKKTRYALGAMKKIKSIFDENAIADGTEETK